MDNNQYSNKKNNQPTNNKVKQKLNIEEIREQFNDYMKRRNWTSRTYETYNYNLNQFFNFLLTKRDKHNIKDITSKDITTFQNYIFYYQDKEGKKYSVNTQILKLVTIKSFFKFLQDKNYIILNPVNDIEYPREEKKLSRRPVKEKEIEKIIQAINHKTILGYRDRVVIELLYATGIRATEVTNIKLNHINFDDNTLLIEQGKGKKDRVVPFAGITKKYLHEYIDRARILHPQGKINPYLFLNKDGKKMKQGFCVTRIVKNYCRKAKIKGQIGAHNFRVTCATGMLMNGAAERYVQEVLGHRDLNSLEHYIKIEISELKKEHSIKHPRERQAE